MWLVSILVSFAEQANALPSPIPGAARSPRLQRALNENLCVVPLALRNAAAVGMTICQKAGFVLFTHSHGAGVRAVHSTHIRVDRHRQ